jgi:hypothetical protein
LQAQPAPGAARTWTDTGSGHTIQAEYLKSDGTNVSLRIAGKEYVTPISRFSKADQDWVRAALAATVTPAVTPPPAPPLPAPPSPAGLMLRGQTVKAGGKVEFVAPVPDAAIKKAAKYTRGIDYDKDTDMKEALVAIAFPEGFDPAKSWPILIVSVTNSGKDKGKEPSSIKAMNGFTESCRDKGWIVMAADLPGNISPGMAANRCALAEAGLEAMAQQWPSSKSWPVATGGFSGGAKYSGWLGGWFAAEGRKILGMFMAGCNEDSASAALKDFKPSRKEFLAAKVFLSAGKDDKIAGPTFGEKVSASLKKTGFGQVRLETFDGPHQLNRDHIAPALKWFTEGGK